MKRFALNFICKNESHVITKMLDSVKPITDLIVALDTGSTDNTIAVIRAFGEKNNIPTYVFERPFDNFCNSRNYALEKLIETAKLLEWEQQDTWGFWIDCDEVIKIGPDFSKEQIQKDIYQITLIVDDQAFSRQMFFSLNNYFYWEGPIHEYIEYDKQQVKSGALKNIQVICEPEGASWKGDLEQKFLNYVDKLQAYVDAGNRFYRWMYYIGDSYEQAATHCNDPERQKNYFLLAKEQYEVTTQLVDINRYQQYRVFMKIANIQVGLDEDWPDIKPNLLTAYAADKRFADPMERIMGYYISKEQWHTANIFSSFAFQQYHQQEPEGKDIVETRPFLYHWKLLFYHYYINISLNTSIASALYKKLKAIVTTQQQAFTADDLQMIRFNSPFIIRWRNWFQRMKQFFIRRSTSENQISLDVNT